MELDDVQDPAKAHYRVELVPEGLARRVMRWLVALGGGVLETPIRASADDVVIVDVASGAHLRRVRPPLTDPFDVEAAIRDDLSSLDREAFAARWLGE